MELNDFYTYGWLFMGAFFVFLEGAALKNRNKGDTLSEHVRKWAGVRGSSTSHKVRRGALGVFLAWLFVHLVFPEVGV